MAEFTAVAEQTVTMNQPVVFTDTVIPCRAGLINHLDDTGLFSLVPLSSGNPCPCCGNDPEYYVNFQANIAIPEGGTAGEEIGLSLQIGGVTIPVSYSVATPTVVDSFFHIGIDETIPVWSNCCQNLAVINTSASDQPIAVKNARIRIVPQS